MLTDESFEGWQSWGLTEKPSMIRPFTEGKNHQTFLIAYQGKKYVLKRFSRSCENAIVAQRCAAEHGIAPAVIYHNEKVAIMDYISGGLPNLNATAHALKVLHQKMTPKYAPTAMNLMASYDEYLFNGSKTLQQQHAALLPKLREFIEDLTPQVFCHGDLVNENCLSTDNGKIAQFVDWEYAARYNPWFDLAAVILYRELDTNQAKEFLRQYNNWQVKINDRIFITSQIAVLWCDLLWHINHYGADYEQQYSHRFEQLNQLNRLL